MTQIKVYQVFSTELSKGAILFGRSNDYTDVANVNASRLVWDNDNYRLGIGTAVPGATLDVRGDVIFNEGGADYDVRMEGDSDANLFFLDASTDRIGIGTNAPGAKLDVRGSAIFNEDGGNLDFRIEGTSDTHLFFVDGSRDAIGIGTSNPTTTYILDINGTVALTRLHGQNSTQNTDDTLYFGADDEDNFFIDRDSDGGQFIIGYNTPRKTGADGAGIFQVYDNSTDRHILLQCKSAGSTGGQEEVSINEGQEDVDFRWETDANDYGLMCDASNANVTINAASVSAHYDLMLAGDGVLGLKETTTPTADTNYGKVYTKSDNKIYFQDGAGSEHKLLHAGDVDISDDTNLTVTSPITLTDDDIGFDASAVNLDDLANTSLADPGADRIVFWDDSDTQFEFLTAGTGLAISTNTLALSHLGIESLSDPNADKLMLWDDTDGAVKFIVVGSNLSYDHATYTLSATGGGTMSSWDLTADSGTNQTVDDGETVDIEGGTGISTSVGATNKVTVTLSHLGIESLSDPGADRILFWDDGETACKWLQVSTGLTLSGTSLTTNDSEIDHDSLNNFAANEHMDTTAWAANLVPDGDNTRDLGAVGATDYRWANLYLAGNLSDETNTVTVANLKTAYDHSQDNTQAHSDYLINNGDDTSSGSLTLEGGGLTLGDATTSATLTLSDGAGGSSTLTQAKWADLEAVNGLVKCNGSGDYSVVTDNSSNWDDAYTHVSSDGTDHTYIDQDVTTTGTPQFARVGIGAAADGTHLLILGATTAVSSILDEDNMASDSATALATQQSIKAYVDAQAGGANTALSNLASVAINTSLVSDADSTDDLGSSTKYWANLYVDKIYLDADSTIVNTDVDAWNTHLSSDGTDHTYIDQDVTSGSSPTLDGTNFTGIPDGALDSTFLKNIVEDTTPQLGGDLDLNGNAIDFPTTANISDCLDEDDMASDSATVLATQQSIKAYSDSLSGIKWAFLLGS